MLHLRNKGEQQDYKLSDRNIRLDEYINSVFPGSIIAGAPKNPHIIYKHEMLSCYIKDNILELKYPLQGNIPIRLSITEIPDAELLLEWYKVAKHSTLYRIKVKVVELFLCGMSKYDGTPVFGNLPNHYRTKDFAQHIIDKFTLAFCEIV